MMEVLAEPGDVKAQFNPELMHAKRHGTPQDYEKVLRWYRQAAQKGNVKARNNLTWMYDQGHDVVKNALALPICSPILPL